MITHIHIFLWGPLYLTSEPCESPFLAFLYAGQKLALKNINKTSNSFIVNVTPADAFLRKTSQNCNTHYKIMQHSAGDSSISKLLRNSLSNGEG